MKNNTEVRENGNMIRRQSTPSTTGEGVKRQGYYIYYRLREGFFVKYDTPWDYLRNARTEADEEHNLRMAVKDYRGEKETQEARDCDACGGMAACPDCGDVNA